eukprot:scaffold2119_cov264-Pinguiococcus_pyrenoidosus.AAC.20
MELGCNDAQIWSDCVQRQVSGGWASVGGWRWQWPSPGVRRCETESAPGLQRPLGCCSLRGLERQDGGAVRRGRHDAAQMEPDDPGRGRPAGSA